MPVERNLEESSLLVIAVTGLDQRLNLPVADFFKKAGLSEVSRIVLRDPKKKLVLDGLPPEHPTFFDLVDFLSKEVSRYSPSSLVIVGTSGGGFTAMLLGHLLRAEYTVVFNTHTYVSPSIAKEKGDPSLRKINKRKDVLKHIPKRLKKMCDIKKVICGGRKETKYYLHVSNFSKWDLRRANHLKSADSVSIVPHPYETHSLADRIAYDGNLRKCFDLPYSAHYELRNKFICKLEMAKKEIKKVIKRSKGIIKN